MALEYASITCELREVKLSNKPLAMINISSKGTVPVLQLVDGRVIDESLDIMLWALGQTDPDHWLDLEKNDGRSLIDVNDQEFTQYLDQYKYFKRYPEHSQLYYREKAEKFIVVLDADIDQQTTFDFANHSTGDHIAFGVRRDHFFPFANPVCFPLGEHG